MFPYGGPGSWSFHLSFCAFRRVLVGLILLLAYGREARAQSSIAILDATGVSILDTTNGQPLARFTLTLQPGETPRTLAASADGSRLFVTTRLAAFTGALHVLDRDTGASLARFAVLQSSMEGRAAPTNDGKQVYFAATVEPPDGWSAAYDNYCDVYKADVEAGTLARVSGTHLAGRCVEALLSPNADRLYLSGTQRLCCTGGATGGIVALALSASGATRLWGNGTISDAPVSALSADGSTLFGRFLWSGRSGTGVRVYDALSGSYVEHNPPVGFGPMAAASNTRVFIRNS